MKREFGEKQAIAMTEIAAPFFLKKRAWVNMAGPGDRFVLARCGFAMAARWRAIGFSILESVTRVRKRPSGS